MDSTEQIVARLDRWPLTLLPEESIVTSADLKQRVGDCPMITCDFYLDCAETGERIPGGFRLGEIDNIDHHAPVPDMARMISSANLAMRYVEAFGAVEGRKPVVIHHTDCDSVLSAGITQGIILPDLRFGRAAISADHTGEENPIADLLQSLEGHRDLELSFRSLTHLIHGEPLPREAVFALQARLEERKIAAAAIENGVFRWNGRVAYGIIGHSLDTVFMPALLPDAYVIMVARPNPDGLYPWQMKLRLGLAAPEGCSILSLGLGQFDPRFGGRWNAGSNRRAGGSQIGPDQYAEYLASAIEGWG